MRRRSRGRTRGTRCSCVPLRASRWSGVPRMMILSLAEVGHIDRAAIAAGGEQAASLTASRRRRKAGCRAGRSRPRSATANLRMWTFRICAAISAAPLTWRSAADTARSSTSGQLVAAITMTPWPDSKPSISTSIWFRSVRVRRCRRPGRRHAGPTASISSMKMMQGACFLAFSNMSRAGRAHADFQRKSEPEMLKTSPPAMAPAPASLAVPGEPTISTPRECPPTGTCSGRGRKSTSSWTSSCFIAAGHVRSDLVGVLVEHAGARLAEAERAAATACIWRMKNTQTPISSSMGNQDTKMLISSDCSSRAPDTCTLQQVGDHPVARRGQRVGATGVRGDVHVAARTALHVHLRMRPALASSMNCVWSRRPVWARPSNCLKTVNSTRAITIQTATFENELFRSISCFRLPATATRDGTVKYVNSPFYPDGLRCVLGGLGAVGLRLIRGFPVAVSLASQGWPWFAGRQAPAGLLQITGDQKGFRGLVRDAFGLRSTTRLKRCLKDCTICESRCRGKP